MALCKMGSSKLLTPDSFHQISVIIRLNSTKTVKFKYTKLSATHAYRNLYPWKSRDEFISHLEKSIIYKSGGLVALNKPYGVAANHPKSKDTVVETLSSLGAEDCPYVLSDATHELGRRLGFRNLDIVKCTERFTSGVVLLAADNGVAKRIRKALLHAKTQKCPSYFFWALTTCVPPVMHCNQRVGIKLVEVPEFDQKAAVIDPNFSKNSIEKQAVKPCQVEFRTITFNNLSHSALVEVGTTQTTWHLLRVYLAYKLSPVLGDSLFSPRVKVVLGKPISISPFNRAAYETPKLNVNLCNHLNMPESASSRVPTHLHLNQVILKAYDRDKQDVVINAPLPNHFLWSLNQLDLLPEAKQLMSATN